MPTNPPLTAAELDTPISLTLHTVLNAQDREAVEDLVLRLMRTENAVCEARALVAALAVDDPGNGDMEYGSRCVWCDVESYTNAHAPDCAWAAARAAKARWSGAGEESE